jgi:hypothetical protein
LQLRRNSYLYLNISVDNGSKTAEANRENVSRPNIKKLTINDAPANVVYKGRYFFDDNVFTQILLEKIGYYHFDNGKKNKTYVFSRETITDSSLYLDKEFLNF